VVAEPETPVVEEAAPEPMLMEVATQAPKPPADVVALWRQVLGKLSTKRLLLNHIRKGSLQSLDGGVSVIAFPSSEEGVDISMAAVNKPENRKTVEEILFGLTGQQFTIKIEKRDGMEISRADREEKAPEPPADPMEEFKNDPLIRRALEIFKAEIQPS
jgi:hypothetical protein